MEINSLISQLKNGSLVLDEQKSYQIGVYMHTCSVDLRFEIWVALQNNIDNLYEIHPFIIDLMVATSQEKSTIGMVPPTIQQARLIRKKSGPARRR